MNWLRYQFADATYTLPWNTPDFERLKLWYRQLRQTQPESQRFELYLFGDFWSSLSQQSRLVTIFLVPTNGFVRTLTRCHRLAALKTMTDGYQIALQRHRLILDLMLTDLVRLRRIHSRILDIERGRKHDFCFDTALEPVETVPKTIEIKDVDWTLAANHFHGELVEWDATNCLVRQDRVGELPNPERFTNRQRQIMYAPVSLYRLFES